MKKPLTNILNPYVVGFLLTVSLLAGCSGIKPYPNTLNKNLQVRTAADSGSFFSSVRTAVDIHRAGADCKTEYEGTVQLNEKSIDIGIPPNRLSRLVFVFSTYSFFGNSSGTITYETLLKPKAGYTYEAKVSYKDDIYNVSLRESQRGNPASREIETQNSQCG